MNKILAKQIELSPQEQMKINTIVNESFKTIAPFWPLKNLIAVNPLQGLENMPIEEALKLSNLYFEQENLPSAMESINRETIKWLQAYIDEGQSTITMPFRNLGFYKAWSKLVLYDKKIHSRHKEKKDFIKNLPDNSYASIKKCLEILNIAEQEHIKFLTIILSTLSGWASYIKYLSQWSEVDKTHRYRITLEDYLAVRLSITVLLWPQAKNLLHWHDNIKIPNRDNLLDKLNHIEDSYSKSLLTNLSLNNGYNLSNTAKAQLIFCIDVRSEPLRRQIEFVGNYETFGVAGFFGIAVNLTNKVTQETYPSCPVLVSPKHNIEEKLHYPDQYKKDKKSYELICTSKKLYQSVKYNFTTPLALVETIGLISGFWLGLRTFAPNLSFLIKSYLLNKIRKPLEFIPSLDSISFEDQYLYAYNALRIIGLTYNFSPLVVLCSHGSTSENNAYASALDCGACGGRHGSSNAKILAQILNNPQIRLRLSENGINIPQKTIFIAAKHNTATDEIEFYNAPNTDSFLSLAEDLKKAGFNNNIIRLKKLIPYQSIFSYKQKNLTFSRDWAQIRPEWGLAGNAAFIVAPRHISHSLDLDGRCFLHSYDYKQDPQGTYLNTILTAPMIVAQWINMQYLFSTINNVAYGAGSKITHNITGKIAVMQGNASDLMTGLPLQSVYINDKKSYHTPQRLITIVYAPKELIDLIVDNQPILKKIFSNGWIKLACMNPEDKKIFTLNRQLIWEEILL